MPKSVKPSRRPPAEAAALFLRHRALARWVAARHLRRYSLPPGLDRADVNAEAELALYRCCLLYDDALGVTFSGYAARSVRLRLMRISTRWRRLQATPLSSFRGHANLFADRRSPDPADALLAAEDAALARSRLAALDRRVRALPAGLRAVVEARRGGRRAAGVARRTESWRACRAADALGVGQGGAREFYRALAEVGAEGGGRR